MPSDPYSVGTRDPTTGWSTDRASGVQPPPGVGLHVHQDLLTRLAALEASLALVNLGVWTTYTPTLTQSATVTKTIPYASYVKVGRLVTAQAILNVTGSGTASNGIICTLPFSGAGASDLALGTGYVYDSSAGSVYKALVTLQTGGSNTIQFRPNSATGNDFLGASAPMTAGLASGDIVNFTVTYEATS